MIEYNGYVNSVREFLEKGPPDKPERFSLGNIRESFEEWMEREDSEDDDLDENSEEIGDEDTKWAKLMEDLNGKN